MVKTYGEIYENAKKKIRSFEPEFAESTAAELVCFYSGKSHAQLLRDRGLYASERLTDDVGLAVQRYLTGEPLPYIIGEWDFGGMTLKVTKDTLIPREDTLAVSELALTELDGLSNPRILDICTGTGCIGLFLAARIPKARVILGDVSSAALNVAKQNIQKFHLGGRVAAMAIDAMQPAPEFLKDFDLVVSNPPYVTDAEMEELPVSVKEYEPELALRGGEDGLDFYRSICNNVQTVLKSTGVLCFEFGEGQEESVCKILRQNGFTDCRTVKDSNNIIRAVSARRIREEA